MDPEPVDEVPYIEQPEEREATEVLFCFLDYHRPCDAGCMAYTTQAFVGDALKDQQGHCSMIVNMSRVGKHAVIIASMMRDHLVNDKKMKEDQRRVQQPSPPFIPGVPRGR